MVKKKKKKQAYKPSIMKNEMELQEYCEQS